MDIPQYTYETGPSFRDATAVKLVVAIIGNDEMKAGLLDSAAFSGLAMDDAIVKESVKMADALIAELGKE